MPILEIMAIIAMIAAAGAAVIAVAYLTFQRLADWFRERKAKIQTRNRKAISVKAGKDIKDALKNNDVTHMTGIFDIQTDEFVDVQAWQADEVDEQVRQAHKGSKVVVWS